MLNPELPYRAYDLGLLSHRAYGDLALRRLNDTLGSLKDVEPEAEIEPDQTGASHMPPKWRNPPASLSEAVGEYWLPNEMPHHDMSNLDKHHTLKILRRVGFERQWLV